MADLMAAKTITTAAPGSLSVAALGAAAGKTASNMPPAGTARYRMRPATVTAARWDGTEASAQVCAAAFSELRVVVIENKHPLALKPPVILMNLPGLDGKTIQRRTPCWIVQGPAGGQFFCADEDFAELYEPAPAGAAA